MDMTVIRQASANRFQVEVGEHVAYLDFTLAAGRIVLTHTLVPSELEGNGLGGKLAKAALDYARSQGLQVVAQCPFVAAYIRKHPEYQALLAPA
ncbi:GNAT family N-acetyltransferase [Desulfuromonas carbonis]|uniref:GNAT family N-acetyltransferase n=1 Tax=Desulfuromonas sp. DDH964 TaxID=1823759 RepID=UPI00078C4C83|nr:GNAT family N-acetyltransferase [Desulfuromonas sp. DDH964]AMV71083.1 hypothetical protein DBW_0696 [Desulfuromonas sp. DDH964]